VKVRYYFLVIVVLTMSVYSLMLSSTNDELLYAQEQEQNQTYFLDKQSNQEMNLTLGNPIYTEIFTVPKSQNKIEGNLTESIYAFSGNGTLNGLKVSATGSGLMAPREDGTRSISDGRALFTSEDGGFASYSFQAIVDTKDNVTQHLGAAFFDANATGNLEYLKSIVGVYEALIDEQGSFAMWQFK
jgi:hypothetical protein